MIWKIIAIIFIVISMVEFGILYWWWNAGAEYTYKDTKCAYEICNLLDESNNYDSYSYDSYEDLCYCFESGEIVKTEYMGD